MNLDDTPENRAVEIERMQMSYIAWQNDARRPHLPTYLLVSHEGRLCHVRPQECSPYAFVIAQWSCSTGVTIINAIHHSVVAPHR